mmetsp:Transcript_34867/g.51838  ORF Transcript_34867/g.51838 Transcript_34867/m.51838 type:complete len:1326 (-) Transcript_34867:90-4067(-)
MKATLVVFVVAFLVVTSVAADVTSEGTTSNRIGAPAPPPGGTVNIVYSSVDENGESSSHRNLQAPAPGPWNTLNTVLESCEYPNYCEQCRGNCNHDGQCRDMLECKIRESWEAVQGCQGDGVQGANYCYHPDVDGFLPSIVPFPTPGPTVDPTTYEEFTCPVGGASCAKCKGNCVSDADCQGGLVCYIRAADEPVYGCTDPATAVSGANYCGEVTPAPSQSLAPTSTPMPTSLFDRPGIPDITLVREEPNCSPDCEVCTGHCSSDADCLGELQCFTFADRGNTTGPNAPVPGCVSDDWKGSWGVGYCIDYYNNLTFDPQVPPTYEEATAGTYFDHELTGPDAGDCCRVYAADPGELVPVPFEGDTGVGLGSTSYMDTTWIYVVDYSASTLDDQGISSCGNQNEWNDFEIIDCEISAIRQANDAAIEGGAVSLTGLVRFSHSDGTEILSNLVPPWQKSEGQQRDEDVILPLRTQYPWGNTNFSGGVDSACELATSPDNTNSKTVVIFVSDGKPNRGFDDQDLIQNNCGGAIFRTFAVTSSAACNEVDSIVNRNETWVWTDPNTGIDYPNFIFHEPNTLQEIADYSGGTCELVGNVEDLPAKLTDLQEAKIVEVYLTVNGNRTTPTVMNYGSLEGTPPFTGPRNTTYTGSIDLGPGAYEICTISVSEQGGQLSESPKCFNATIYEVSMSADSTVPADGVAESPVTVSLEAPGPAPADCCSDVERNVTCTATGGGPNDGMNVESTIAQDGSVTLDLTNDLATSGTDVVTCCYLDPEGNDACDIQTTSWEAVPTGNPTASPTGLPTSSPTAIPTTSPTTSPTGVPTSSPTTSPTTSPTLSPTGAPTIPDATPAPSGSPTTSPTSSPTTSPTTSPTASPTTSPTGAPTMPDATPAPSGTPTTSPTPSPTTSPTGAPTVPDATPVPSGTPTTSPTFSPTTSPTSSPTGAPTAPGDTDSPTAAYAPRPSLDVFPMSCNYLMLPPNTCASDPQPACRPLRFPAYCSTDESFLDLLTARHDEYTTNLGATEAAGYWYPQLEDKVVAKLFLQDAGFNVPELLLCSEDMADGLSSLGATPAGGIVVKALGLHSDAGVYVLPNGFGGTELLSGTTMTMADVQAALAATGATKFIVEAYVGSPTVLPDEFKYHMFDGTVGSIVYTTNRGSECECFAELDENWNRVDTTGCIRPGDHEELAGGSTCAAIGMQSGLSVTMKGLDMCTNAPPPDPSLLTSLTATATQVSELIGVYMRIDMYEGADGNVYVGELTPNHTNGRVHCTVKMDFAAGCLDACYLGKLWAQNAGDSMLHGGSALAEPSVLTGGSDFSSMCATIMAL